MLKITDNIKLGKLVGSSGSTSGSGGSSNYNDLENKPSINSVELSGNKTSSELGVLDLNTTENQTLKSALFIEKGLVINYNNNPIAGLFCDNNNIGLGALNETTEVRIISKNTIIVYTPTILHPTTLADLPDNAILTKSQVQEMINNALNNS